MCICICLWDVCLCMCVPVRLCACQTLCSYLCVWSVWVVAGAAVIRSPDWTLVFELIYNAILDSGFHQMTALSVARTCTDAWPMPGKQLICFPPHLYAISRADTLTAACHRWESILPTEFLGVSFFQSGVHYARSNIAPSIQIISTITYCICSRHF